ncbi:MAG: hypothetical protein J6X70_01045 [Muribaculaceae bacterium]|nr:hypothetical protein [Muribaculaceae bacterium]
MKNVLMILVMVMCSVFVQAQEVEGFVTWQLETYPKSRLLDLYKSCFQDFMGAEHLVGDRQRAKVYLDEELETATLDELQPWYFEPCGIDGRYVRVSLRAVKEGLITEEQLLDTFVRSANGDRRPVETWRARWQDIIAIIDQMAPNLPHYAEDRQFIDDILDTGKYAISHSPDYRDAYHPHYRIVEESIFDQEIAPYLPPSTMH